MTFSIAGRCAETGMFGIAISSSSPAVAARCAHLRGGVGAACSQNITDPRLGPALLDRLAAGDIAPEAIEHVTRHAEHIEFRQLTVLDQQGVGAGFSGEGTLGVFATARTENAVAAGNLLANRETPAAMVAAFAASAGQPLGDRLIAALQAGLDSGGETQPVHSAGLLLATDLPWPVTDLRVDWSDDPIHDLAALWRLWRPQQDAYVLRALNPEAAPGYFDPERRA